VLVRAFAAAAAAADVAARAKDALDEFFQTLADFFQTFAAPGSRRFPDASFAKTDAVAKEHVGVRDRTEVRFVKGVPRFSKIASKIERDERDERDDKKKRGDENRRRGVLLTVDGRPVRGRAALRPGALLQIGGLEYEVLRDVRAHA
jgi:hypothetical protein